MTVKIEYYGKIGDSAAEYPNIRITEWTDSIYTMTTWCGITIHIPWGVIQTVSQIPDKD